MTTTGKLFVTFIILVGVGIGAFFYLTRPISAPTTETSLSPSPSISQSSSPSLTKVLSIINSKVQFEVKETLNGKPNTAIGSTDSISGDITLDLENPEKSQVSMVEISAFTLKTDSDRRDAAIARFILHSDKPENQYIQFIPTAIKITSGTLAIGKTANLTVTGDLKISDTTHPATFTGTAQLKSDSQLIVSMVTVVKRSDYHLQIPSVPFVASVDDNVTLKADLDFEEIHE